MIMLFKMLLLLIILLILLLSTWVGEDLDMFVLVSSVVDRRHDTIGQLAGSGQSHVVILDQSSLIQISFLSLEIHDAILPPLAKLL